MTRKTTTKTPMTETQAPGKAALAALPTGRPSQPDQAPNPTVCGLRRTHPLISNAPVSNRIRTLMMHAPRYSFQGQARLASDAGVSRSTISRLLGGRINPSFRLAQAVTSALEKSLKRPLDPREILSPDGTYPTPSGCELAGCRGCMPEEAYDKEGRLRPEYRDLRPGDWSLSRPSPQQELQQQPAHQKQNHQHSNNHGKETR